MKALISFVFLATLSPGSYGSEVEMLTLLTEGNHACNLTPPGNASEAVDQSDLVIRGRIESIYPLRDIYHPQLPQVVAFPMAGVKIRVLKVMKGEAIVGDLIHVQHIVPGGTRTSELHKARFKGPVTLLLRKVPDLQPDQWRARWHPASEAHPNDQLYTIVDC